MNQRIIDPVDTEAITAELTPERFLRTTNKGGNEIYRYTSKEKTGSGHILSPATLPCFFSEYWRKN